MVEEQSLIDAILSEDVKRVAGAIARGADPNARRSEGGHPALAVATTVGNIEIVRLLLNAGADPNARNDGGETPLTVAREAPIMDLLVERGASVRLEKSDDRYTSVHAAAARGNVDQLVLLIERADGKQALESFDLDDKTPLCYAAEDNHLEAARYLVSVGADVNACNQATASFSPLQLAVEGGHVEMARLLLEAGANPFLAAGLSTSPFDMAAEVNGDMEKVVRIYAERYGAGPA